MARDTRLHRKDSVESGVRRIACARIDRAIAAIDDADLSPAKAVHEVRKQCKALRGLLRLIRAVFADYKLENAEFREIAAQLSGARDAKVLLDTFDAVIAEAPEDTALTAVRARLLSEQGDRTDSRTALLDARIRLVAARERAAVWQLSESGWSALVGGLTKTYKRGRKAMALTAHSTDPQVSHDWRKRVKYHGHHIALLREIRPEPMKRRRARAKALDDQLGERHDIDVLIAAMAQTPRRFGGIVTVARLAQLARARAARLDKRAMKEGRRLYHRKPAKLARQWHRWWRAWRSGDA